MLLIFTQFSESCTIELEDWVVITGGSYEQFLVMLCNIDGWVQRLPDLNNYRYDHGCGHYVDTNKEIVRLLQNKTMERSKSKHFMQVYLVAGGRNNYGPINSTEILSNGDNKWTDVSPLPTAITGLRGVLGLNKIIMTGNKRQNQSI